MTATATLPDTVHGALAKITVDQPGGGDDDELVTLLLANHAIDQPKAEVGGYTRLSEFRGDAGDSGDIGVVRQAKDILRFATSRRVRVTEFFADNDFSAANKWRKRPDYTRLFAKLTAGTLGGVVGWDLDRLYRQPRELEDLIDLGERRNLYVATQSGELDLTTGDGKFQARILVNVAAKGSDDISRRQKPKVAARAAKGLWHGGVIPFGYRQANKKGHLDVDRGEAKIVRLAATMVLEGQGLSGVVRHLNDNGMLTRSGAPWRRTSLRAMLLRPALAGLRQHQPRIKNSNEAEPGTTPMIVKAVWNPILSEAEHAALRALLLSENRRTTPLGGGHARKFVGVGYIACGRCAASGVKSKVIGKTGQSRGYRYEYYICEKCYVRRDAPRVDGFIRDAVVDELASVPHSLGDRDADPTPLLVELEDIAEREEALSKKWAGGDFAERNYDAAMGVLATRRAAAEERLATLGAPEEAEPQDPAVFQAMWDEYDLEGRQGMIADSGLTFLLNPVGRGSHSTGMSIPLD